MSSEAAQKAYPIGDEPWGNMVHFLNQEAFDRGAVEALRQAAALLAGLPTGAMTGATRNQAMRSILDLAQKWEVGQ